MSSDPWLVEKYFDWLRMDCFSTREESLEYEGCLRLLHDIPFYWTNWSDENRVGDALSFRQHDFLQFQMGVEALDQVWLGTWATAAPSVLEVLLGIARRWMFYFEEPIWLYFTHMFKNLELDRYPGKILSTRAQTEIRTRIDIWLSRQFGSNGQGSPFPLQNGRLVDMRSIDIWGQMNAYSAEHFQ